MKVGNGLAGLRAKGVSGKRPARHSVRLGSGAGSGDSGTAGTRNPLRDPSGLQHGQHAEGTGESQVLRGSFAQGPRKKDQGLDREAEVA